MSERLLWNHVDKTSWTYESFSCSSTFFAFRIASLPNFTDPHFGYLCKEIDQRASEIAKRQLDMLRSIHSLGDDFGISLRFIKDGSGIVLYLVFRWSTGQLPSESDIQLQRNNISQRLMKEYSFLPADTDIDRILDLSNANEVCRITKYEREEHGDEYPIQGGGHRSFYCSSLWVSSDNDMEKICTVLLQHQGFAVIDVTIEPTSYLQDEKEWVNLNISLLKDSMNGEKIYAKDGHHLIFSGKKLPILQEPINNYDRLNKQYEASRVFISSFRVFADQNSHFLAEMVMSNCVKNEGIITQYSRGTDEFRRLEKGYLNVTCSPDVPTKYWIDHTADDTAPMRAQRLNQLCSLEEVVNFFRIPIPTKSGFPGFSLDTGLGESSHAKPSSHPITIGNYMDKAVSSETAAFDAQQLAKHGLIVGVPGSGKTTAMFNILDQLWNCSPDSRIPFIVMEPAKTEYRALKTLPGFQKDLLVFTLGDESVSPFRFNPLEVLPGIRIENHISRLQACFVGAFDLFDPLPIFLDKAIRRTYQEKGWYDDSCGGDPGLETPTLDDLCRNAEYEVEHSGFDPKLKSNIQASLLERLNSLRRGAKGRMLNTKQSIPIDDLMRSPVILELDSLNADEKSLLMMFLLTYVYEYCKVFRRSGSPLKHLLVVEEAHNLISSQGAGNNNRGNPKEQTIELFVNMLAEMRALGQGILIADQLPTAIAPQAVKQTNVKMLMRVTARDDREEIGNTMDLNEEQMHQVVHFKTGHAYIYHEGEDLVRMVRMTNFKDNHQVSEPPSDAELKDLMASYEKDHRDLYLPYPECHDICDYCSRRTRNQAEAFVAKALLDPSEDAYAKAFPSADDAFLSSVKKTVSIYGVAHILASQEKTMLESRYGELSTCFGRCVLTHILHKYTDQLPEKERCKNQLDETALRDWFSKYNTLHEGE